MIRSECILWKICCTTYTATLSSHGYHFSSLRVGLTHSWYRPKAEVQHQVLLQNAPDGGGGSEDGGAAFEFDS